MSFTTRGYRHFAWQKEPAVTPSLQLALSYQLMIRLVAGTRELQPHDLQVLENDQLGV